MRADLESVFGPLVHDPCWVAYREEERGGKRTKPPYSPVTGSYASSTDPATWATLEEAMSYAERAGMDGVGIVLREGLGGVDLDGCRNPATGEIAPWARKIVDGFNTYTEVSPSGTGLKLYAFGAPSELPASTIPMDTPPINGKRPAVEAYTSGRYFAVTGDLLPGCPDEIRDAGEVGDGWDRMIRLLRERSTNGTGPDRETVEPTGATELSGELRAALEGEGKAGRLWREGKDGGTDRSRNDAALAGTLGAMGFSDADIEAAIRAYPLGQVHQEARTPGYDVDRQLSRLLGLAERARENRDEDEPEGVTLADFRAYMPEHKYIFVPSRELWPASSVDARLPAVQHGDQKLKASKWLDREQAVEQMSWAPGQPMLIRDRLISHGGWIHRPGVTCFNLYRPPTIEPGDPSKATPWVEHAERVFDDSAEHIIRYLAQRVQHPGQKINHALVMGGLQGIGKDTLLEPVKHGVGPWNFMEVAPPHLLGRFNGFVKSVILRVSEARDLGDVDRYSFYDHLKSYTAAPPDVLRVDEKHLREISVPNVMGVIITTNHKTDGIYLPSDDRRHFVAWSERTKDDFTDTYWRRLWTWYEQGGIRHVVAFLQGYDLASFDPKAPPPKTAAFWDIVDANRAPEDAELADALDRLQNPTAVTLGELAEVATSSFADWLTDRRNYRQIPHRMEAAGYVSVRNDAAKDGKWKVGGRRQVIYCPQELSVRDRIEAAQELMEGAR